MDLVILIVSVIFGFVGYTLLKRYLWEQVLVKRREMIHKPCVTMAAFRMRHTENGANKPSTARIQARPTPRRSRTHLPLFWPPAPSQLGPVAQEDL